MASGGVRPGAGRPKGARNRAIVQAEAARTEIELDNHKFDPKKYSRKPKAIQVNEEAGSSAVLNLLNLVVAGKSHDENGVEITPQRIAAAKELLPFFEAKRATTHDKRGPQRPLVELTDDELRQIVHDQSKPDQALQNDFRELRTAIETLRGDIALLGEWQSSSARAARQDSGEE